MNGTRSSYDGITPISLETFVVSLAESPSLLSKCKRDILQVGGTWPPDGMTLLTDQGTSCLNAQGATSSTKECNGSSGDGSTSTNQDSRRASCAKPKKNGRTKSGNFLGSLPISNHAHVTALLRKELPHLSKDEAHEVQVLRGQRRDDLIEISSKKMSEQDPTKYDSLAYGIGTARHRLLQLTGLHAFNS